MMRRVVVFGMHEPELATAQSLVQNATTANEMVIGEMNDDDIAKARAEGLVVQVQPPPPDRTPLVVPLDQSLGLQSLPGDKLVRERGIEEAAPEVPAEIDYYALDLDRPLIDQTRKALESAGASIIAAMPGGGYEIRAKRDAIAAIREVPGVIDCTWLTPESSAVETATQAAPAPKVGERSLTMLTYDVRLRDPKDRQKIESWLKGRHVGISGSSGRKIRFFVVDDSAIPGRLARLSEVDMVTEYIEPVLYNDAARRLLGVDAVAPAANPVPGFDGSGQIIAIADTGIDDTHPDFAGRIVGKIARGRPGRTDDPNGHGTHVAGSALGDGSASGGALKGVAPKARLFFQSLLDAAGRLSGIPFDLHDLFLEAYNAGARIHNNSWGNQAKSNYMINSEEVDDFVYTHPDMVIVIAAGNDGRALISDPRSGGRGWVDWLSIAAPASSKNAITVGASRSDRTDGPNASVTFGMLWPSFFPDTPIADEMVAGNADGLAAFSSRGPCTDHRIKPDVVAPGTDIASTKSSTAPMTNFLGAYPTTGPANPRYAYDVGTSMAAPFVAGCAALAKQYYASIKHEPSAALIKATLVNGTVWLRGADADGPTVGKPNYHQGHGRIDMSRSVPNPTNPSLALFFHDDWKGRQKLSSAGKVVRYQVTVPPNCDELRVSFAYTDLPARGVQNTLYVTVQQAGSSRIYYGNEAVPNALTMPDPDNNLEVIRIPNPDAGTYYIQVIVTNLLKGPQACAFVVTGNGLSDFVSY